MPKYSTVPSGPIAQMNNTCTSTWLLFFQQLINTLQDNFGSEGVVIPSLTTAQIATLGDNGIGRIVFNSDTQMMMLNNNGTFQNITV